MKRKKQIRQLALDLLIMSFRNSQQTGCTSQQRPPDERSSHLRERVGRAYWAMTEGTAAPNGHYRAALRSTLRFIALNADYPMTSPTIAFQENRDAVDFATTLSNQNWVRSALANAHCANLAEIGHAAYWQMQMTLWRDVLSEIRAEVDK